MLYTNETLYVYRQRYPPLFNDKRKKKTYVLEGSPKNKKKLKGDKKKRGGKKRGRKILEG